MAHFTIEFYKVHEILGDSGLGLDTYPIFSEQHRAVLNEKILSRYMMREIGHESISLFAHFFKARLNEMMPYFNKLYESETLNFDPTITMRIESENTSAREDTTDSNSTAESTSNSTNKSRTVVSSTPQTMLSGDADYASGATDAGGVADSSTTSGDSATMSAQGTAESAGRTTGMQGSAGRLLMEWRESLINVDMAVLDSLNELFMSIYDTADDIIQIPYLEIY